MVDVSRGELNLSPYDSASIPKNTYRFLDDGSVEMELVQGKVVLLDAVDTKVAFGYRWRMSENASGHCYVKSTERTEGKSKGIYLHRLVCSAPKGLNVDHIDGDTMNNRRANLRLATTSQNSSNAVTSRNNRSGFKGVYFGKGKWIAQLRSHFHATHLGCYQTADAAARAYDEAARQVYGEFARVNFPLEGERAA